MFSFIQGKWILLPIFISILLFVLENATIYIFIEKMRQDEFLIANGILDELQAHYDPNPFSEVSKRNRQIRNLILPNSISQYFHVILQGKGFE